MSYLNSQEVVPRVENELEVLKTPDEAFKKSNLIPNASNLGGGLWNFNGFKTYDPVIFNHFASERNHNRPLLVVVTGTPGTGKTYGATRIGQIFDPNFQIIRTDKLDSLSRSNVVFSREHLQYLIDNDSPLKRGAAIVIDESQLVIGGRHWMFGVQQDIVEKMEAIRSRGYFVLLVILHRSMLDSQMRNFTLSHQIHFRKPGEGVVYKLSSPVFGTGDVHQKRLGKIILQLPWFEQCAHPSCLDCRYLYPNGQDVECPNPRAIYERNKHDFIGAYKGKKDGLPKKKPVPDVVITTPYDKEMREATNTTPTPTEFDDMAQKLLEHQQDIRWDSNGIVNIDDAVRVLWSNYRIHKKKSDVVKAVTQFKRLLRAGK